MFRLPRPLLWSFGVHFVLGLGIMGYFLKGGFREPEEIPFELQLSDVHVHHLDSVRNRSPVPEVSRPAGIDPAPSSSEPSADSLGRADAATPGDLSDMSGGARNQYLGTLIRLISSRKSYPRASILNEEEGVVQVRVVLGTGGKVMSVERVVSSGFDRLDDAAIETLRSFQDLPLPPGHPSGVRLLIPIRFEINPEH